MLRAAVLAFFIAVTVGVILLLLGALVLSLLPASTVHSRPLGCALGALTALLGGIAAGRLHRHAGALSGALFFVLYLLLLLAVSRFVSIGTALTGRVLGYALFLVLSLLGGALGGMRLERRHRRRRR